MKQTIHLRSLAMCLALPILVVGCGKTPNEQLAEFAQQTMTEQIKQNDRMAEQSQAVVEESHQLAEAAKELVEHDAAARRELIIAQAEFTTQLNEQQSVIHQGHQRLEQDRREIAEQRQRDPIIAAMIQNIGLILACLLPLIVAVLVIRQMQSQEPDHAAVAELLVFELTSEEPRLLPGSRIHSNKMTHAEEEAQFAQTAADSTGDVEPPF